MNTNIDNELSLEIPVRKEYFISIIMCVMVMSVYICFDIIQTTIAGHNPLLSKIFMLISAFVGYKYLSWRIRGRRTITLDEKYLIINDICNNKSKNKVYRLAFINNLTVDTEYKITLLRRIIAFWTLDNVGRIGFYYGTNFKGKPNFISIGYGLTSEEAIRIFSSAKEKGWIQNYEKSTSMKLECTLLKRFIAVAIGFIFVLITSIFLSKWIFINSLTYNEMIIGCFLSLILIPVLFLFVAKSIK